MVSPVSLSLVLFSAPFNSLFVYGFRSCQLSHTRYSGSIVEGSRRSVSSFPFSSNTLLGSTKTNNIVPQYDDDGNVDGDVDNPIAEEHLPFTCSLSSTTTTMTTSASLFSPEDNLTSMPLRSTRDTRSHLGGGGQESTTRLHASSSSTLGYDGHNGDAGASTNMTYPSSVQEVLQDWITGQDVYQDSQQHVSKSSIFVRSLSPASSLWKLIDNVSNPILSWCTQQIQTPTEHVGRAIAVIAAAIYGTNFAVVKMLDDTVPTATAASLRFVFAFVVVASLTLYQEATSDIKDSLMQINTIYDEKAEEKDLRKPSSSLQKERNAAVLAGAEIGLWYSVGYICQALSLETLEAGKNAFYNALAVVLVPLLDFAFRNKVLKFQDMVSVGLALLGVAILEIGPTGDFSFTPSDMLALCQTIFFGIGYWRLEGQSHKQQTARLTMGQLAGVAVGSIVFMGMQHEIGNFKAGDVDPIGFPNFQQFVLWFHDPLVLGALIWTALISTAMALYLETVALKVISASELTLLMTTVSIWGSLFAYITLGEVLSMTGMIGGALILAGCVFGNFSVEGLQTSPRPLTIEMDDKHM